MLRIAISAFLVLTFLGGAGIPGAAQESIPRELVLALLQGYEHPGQTVEPKFVVGQLPTGVPAEAVPQGAEILGGVWSPSRSTAAMRLVGPYQQAHAALTEAIERLEADGWEPVPLGATIFASREHQLARMRAPAPMYCKDGSTLRSSFAPGDAGALIRIDVDRRGEPLRCASERGQPLVGVPLPELHAPDGVEIEGRSTSAGPDEFEARAEVKTDLTPVELIAHYSAQLTAAGWSAVERSVSETTASQVLRFRDEQGGQWRGTLTAIAVPELPERELRLQIQREGSSPASG